MNKNFRVKIIDDFKNKINLFTIIPMNQKGFANIALIILVAVLAGALGYITLVKKAPQPTPLSNLTDTPLPIPEPTTTSATISTTIPKTTSQTPDHLISTDQIIQMEKLMKKNEKSLDNLQAYRFEKDELGLTHIKFYAYVNGIRADETIYHFQPDETLSSISNEFDASIFFNIPITAKISESQAIALAGSKIKNVALMATKEFWNKNIGQPGVKDIVLAWRVQSNNNSYPFAIIDAQLGKIIYYDNGLRY